MKKIIICVGIIFLIGLYAFSGRSPKPGDCGKPIGFCWVKDLSDGQTIVINNWVIKNCKFIDRETVACPMG